MTVFHLDFALGKAMHDAGRTEEAFTHYARPTHCG